MVTAAKLLYAQTQKNIKILTIEEWIVSMAELAELAKLICLIRKGTTTIIFFYKEWTFMDFFPENEQK